VALVSKEHRWLPVVAGQLPLPIPKPVALGSPAAGFAWPWSVYRWIEESLRPWATSLIWPHSLLTRLGSWPRCMPSTPAAGRRRALQRLPRRLADDLG